MPLCGSMLYEASRPDSRPAANRNLPSGSRLNALGTGPLIRDLRQRVANVQEQELARWTAKLGTLSADDRKLVESVLRGYANKLLHEPLVQIREFANDDEGYLRLDTVRRLFQLGDAAPPAEDEP